MCDDGGLQQQQRRNPRILALALLATLTLGVGACGDDDEPMATTPVAQLSAQDTARVKACGLRTEAGGFPLALVPSELFDEAAIPLSSDGDAQREFRVLVPGTLRTAFVALLAAAPKAGATVQAQEIETFDAEIEITGPTGEIELRLEPAPSCGDGTVVRVERR